MTPRLTPRQRQCVQGVIDAKPDKIIAAEMGLAPRTMSTYLHNIFVKTGAQNRGDLANMYREAFKTRDEPISFEALSLLAESVPLSGEQCRNLLMVLLSAKGDG